MWKRIAIAALLCLPGVALLAAGVAKNHGFYDIRQVKFDGGTSTPKIPKTWQFVAVANGSTVNSNTLWFQDKDSTIYMVAGFISPGGFVMQPNIHRLEAEDTDGPAKK